MPTKKNDYIINTKAAETEAVQEFITPENKLVEEIEQLVLEENITILEAAIHIAESRGIELELLGSLLKKSSNLKKRLTEECRELHCLKT